LKAFLLTATLLGLCAEAVAAPISLATRMPESLMDLVPSDPSPPAADDLFPQIAQTTIEDQTPAIATDLGGNLPDSQTLAEALTRTSSISTVERPATALVIGGLVAFGTAGMLHQRRAPPKSPRGREES
jgi:hypothetical protein